MMQSKIEALKEDHKELRERLERFEENYVSVKQFEAVTRPIQESMREMQRDIKKIIGMLSRNEPIRPH